MRASESTDRTTEGGDTMDAEVEGRRSLFARTFTVFAAEQVDGVDYPIVRDDLADEAGRLVDAEGSFGRITAHVECGGNMACYVPSLDTIRLPAFGRFERPTDFYSTSAHERLRWRPQPGGRGRASSALSPSFEDTRLNDLRGSLGWAARVCRTLPAVAEPGVRSSGRRCVVVLER